MMRKGLVVFASVAAALLMVGAAWAWSDLRTQGDANLSAEAEADASKCDDPAVESTLSASGEAAGEAAGEIDATPPATSGSTSAESSTSASVDSTTSASVESSTSSTSTTIPASTTSTSSPGDDEAETVADEIRSLRLDGVGTVDVGVIAGELQLLAVNAESGWEFEIDKAEQDRIEIEFFNGSSRAELEAELKDGSIESFFESWIDISIG